LAGCYVLSSFLSWLVLYHLLERFMRTVDGFYADDGLILKSHNLNLKENIYMYLQWMGNSPQCTFVLTSFEVGYSI